MHLVGSAGRKNTTAHNEQLLSVLQHTQVASVVLLLASRDPDPGRASLAETPVNVDVTASARADNDGAVLAAIWGPDIVGRALGDRAVGGDELVVLSRIELLGVGGEAVKERELVVRAVGWAAAILVCHDVLAVGQEGDGGHARAVGVARVTDVIDDGTPVDAVGGGLVDHLLAVCSVVALVGVIADELLLVQHQERLPNGSETVVGSGFASSSNVGDELPCVALVSRSVQLDLSGGEIGRDGATRQQNGASGPLAELLRKNVDEGLVAETVLRLRLIVDARDLLPVVSAIGRLIDWEVDLRLWVAALRAVILPCRKKVAVLELGSTSVQSARVGVVRWRRENNTLIKEFRNL